MSDARWPKATKEHPCPKCGSTNRCKVAPDGGAVVCWRDGGKLQQLNGHQLRDLDKKHGPTLRAAINGDKLYPAAEDAITAARLRIKGATLVGTWVYHGDTMHVARFDLTTGKKEFRPVHRTKAGWKIGDPPGLLPLYRLPDSKTIYVCEGEKATDAAVLIGLPATTSAHGSSGADKSDWSPLAGREVVILPDHDEPGAKYARDVARILLELNPPAKVKIVELPGLPDGGDIVEFVAAGGTREDIEGLASDTETVDSGEVIGGPMLIDMSDVKRVPITWLWPGRIPQGRCTLLAGMPGCGKSFFTTDIAARITAALPWPDHSGDAPHGSVLMIVAEDNPGDTIGPRLDAAGADTRPGRIKLLAMVKHIDPDTGKAAELCFTLAHVRDLETAIRSMPDLKLIIVDPIGSFMGARVDAHRDNEVRSVLAPVAAMAEKYNVAVLIVAHVRKALTSTADDGVLGSRAFTGLARVVWHLITDKADRDRRLLLPGKCNIAAQPDGLAFTITGTPPAIVWEPAPVKMHADDLLADNAQPGPEPEARKAAEEWLLDALKDGPVQSGDLRSPEAGTIRAMAKDADFKWATVRRAADKLGVRREQNRFDKKWYWRLLKKSTCSPMSKSTEPEQLEQLLEQHGKTESKQGIPIALAHQDSAIACAREEIDAYDEAERLAIAEGGM